MYVPAAFALGEDEAWEFLEQSRLGLLVSCGAEGLAATHLPFVVDRAGGRLLGHVARPNPHAAHGDDVEALAVLTGPEAYISPGWYATKAEHGRVVPTWNYEAVHVRGRLRWFEDGPSLRDVLDRLTRRFEAGRPTPWSLDDAPADYLDRLLAGIVGCELTVTAVEGGRKLSQNQPERNRAGVVAGLSAGDLADQAVAARMLALTA